MTGSPDFVIRRIWAAYRVSLLWPGVNSNDATPGCSNETCWKLFASAAPTPNRQPPARSYSPRLLQAPRRFGPGRCCRNRLLPFSLAVTRPEFPVFRFCALAFPDPSSFYVRLYGLPDFAAAVVGVLLSLLLFLDLQPCQFGLLDRMQ